MKTLDNGLGKLIVITVKDLEIAVSSIMYDEVTNDYYVDGEYLPLFKELNKVPTLEKNVVIYATYSEMEYCHMLVNGARSIDEYAQDLVYDDILYAKYSAKYANNIRKAYMIMVEAECRAARLLGITDEMCALPF